VSCGNHRRHTLENVASEWDRQARRAEAANDETASRWRRAANRAVEALVRYAELSEEVGE
jgi:hypothetical protein